MAKRYRVTYFQESFDRYGEKDYAYYEQWVNESTLIDIQYDRRVDDLQIHEEQEYGDFND